MASLRKLISIKEDENNKINNYAQKERITFSEFVRKAANFYIDKQEEIELGQYLKENCDSVSKEEQADIENWIKELKNHTDYDFNEGSEITLEKIIQGNL